MKTDTERRKKTGRGRPFFKPGVALSAPITQKKTHTYMHIQWDKTALATVSVSLKSILRLQFM